MNRIDTGIAIQAAPARAEDLVSSPPRPVWAPLVLASTLVLLPACTTAPRELHPDLPHAFDAGWRGQATCEVLHENDQVRVGLCTFPPGVGHERHYHRPHFGYSFEGGTMRIEDEEGVREIEIPAGTHWSSDEVTVHQAFNVGETTTSYLIVEPK